MKAQCPKCKAVYNIDDAKIPEKGAQATCSKCKTRFQITKNKIENDGNIPQVIITCPNCGHVNVSAEKCSQCGNVFSEEDRENLAIKI